MKAIVTKYHGPTDFRGSRISVDDGDGNKVFYAHQSALSSEANHRKAAIALCTKMNWHGRLAEGHTKDGMVFVWVVDGVVFEVL